MSEETVDAGRTAPRRRMKTREEAAPPGDAGGPDTINGALDVNEPVLVLGGRRFAVRPLTLRDLATIEKEYGSISSFFSELQEQRISHIAYFTWLLLRKSEPRLTVDEAAELIPLHALGEVTQKLMASSGMAEAMSGNGGPAPAG